LESTAFNAEIRDAEGAEKLNGLLRDICGMRADETGLVGMGFAI
jgi:hypothetical protein